MGMIGEIANAEGGMEERGEVEEQKMLRKYTASAAPALNASAAAVVVGYALTSKKIKSFLQPKLERLARKKGILFVPIDPTRPLSDQGPFNIVLHKLSGKEWRHILEDANCQLATGSLMPLALSLLTEICRVICSLLHSKS